MSHETVNNQYQPDLSRKELIRGVGMIVLNANHEILVGREQLPKREHLRSKGQLSIPLETFKINELGNVNAMRLAALSEVITAETIDNLRKHLREAAFKGPIPLGESGIHGLLSVMHWEGDPSEMPFSPSVPGEFDELSWMMPSEAVRHAELRPYAQAMIQYADEQGLLNGLSNRPVPLLEALDVNKYHAIRQDNVDIGNP